MSTDYGAKEKEFLDALKGDTGRTLDEWMSAIAAQGLTQRNDIIDWLRRQGFMFSKASWIERIHNNGGRPIYADAGTQRPRVRPRAPARPRGLAPAVTPAAPAAPASPSVPAPAPSLPSASPAAPPASDPAALDAVLGRAKAYRPLAVYVVAEIRKAVPAAQARVAEGGVIFETSGRAFAALTVSGKDLKLALALATNPPDVPLEPARGTLRTATPMPRMIVLTDARQITPALLAALNRAAAGP